MVAESASFLTVSVYIAHLQDARRVRICPLIAFLSQELPWKTWSGNRNAIEKEILGLEFEIVKSHYKIHILQWNKLINESILGHAPKVHSYKPTYFNKGRPREGKLLAVVAVT